MQKPWGNTKSYLKDFKSSISHMFKELKEIMYEEIRKHIKSKYPQIGNINKRYRNYNKKIKSLELKNIITEMKNSLEKFNNRCEQEEKQTVNL